MPHIAQARVSFDARELCVRLYLELHARHVLHYALPSGSIHHLNLNLPFTFGQQLITHPVLVCKVAGAALVGVVLAQHALQPVAAVVPAHTSERGEARVYEACWPSCLCSACQGCASTAHSCNLFQPWNFWSHSQVILWSTCLPSAVRFIHP